MNGEAEIGRKKTKIAKNALRSEEEEEEEEEKDQDPLFILFLNWTFFFLSKKKCFFQPYSIGKLH